MSKPKTPEQKTASKKRSADWYKKNKGKNRESHAANQRAWRAANPDKVRAMRKRVPSEALRAIQLRVKYSLTVAEYENMLATQGGECAICRNVERSKDRGGKLRRLAVDHDHVSRRVRGLLCSFCNRAIGLLKDDPTIVEAAFLYLVLSP